MSITERAIRANRVTLALVFVAAAGGLYALYSLPRAEDPGFTIRTAMVMTFFPGAEPGQVERLVTDELEETFLEMAEVKEITSESRRGVSAIKLEIHHQYDDLDQLWDEVREKIRKRRDELPEGIIGPIVNDDFGDVYGIVVGVAGDGAEPAELRDISEEMRDDLLALTDASKVKVHGLREERVFVEFENERLAELGLSPLMLRDALEAANLIAPGGVVRLDEQRLALVPTGDYESIDQVRKTAVFIRRDERLAFLKDIARVRRGYEDPPKTKVHISGREGVAVTISLREDGNIIRLGEEVRALLAGWRERYPLDIAFEVVAFQPDAVDEKIDEFMSNVAQSVAIVCLVMLLFLGLRTGLVVATLIPTAMLATFTIMRLTDIGLDQVSLAALIIALGMLVDNAVVVSESIMVEMGEGVEPVEAAGKTGRELWAPLLISSLTTAAGFLPIFIADSMAGEYTAPLFKVVTITLLCSWAISQTFTPLLCIRYLQPATQRRKRGRFKQRVYAWYTKSLMGMLRHRGLTVVCAVLAFVLAAAAFQLVPFRFFPSNDRDTFTCELEFPEGTAIEEVERAVAEVEGFLRRELLVESPSDGPGVLNWGAFIGEGGPRYILTHAPETPRPEYAFLLVNTTSFEDNRRIMRRLKEFCLSRLPDAEAILEPVATGPPVDRPVMIRILGDEPEVLFQYAEAVKKRLRGMEGVANVGDDWGMRAKRFVVDIDSDRALRAGLTNRDIAVSMQTSLAGLRISTYREDDELIPIVLQSVSADETDLARLENLQVYSQRTGRSAPLKQVAEIQLTWRAGRIFRRDGRRAVTAEAGLMPGFTARKIVNEITPWLREGVEWRPGYAFEIGGTVEESREANQAILVKIPVAGFIVFMLLIVEFNSFRRTLITLLTIPLALIGVVIGLLVMRSYFGFMTLLGVISLSGIVINNAIVLLERIEIERRDLGRDPRRAIVEAARRRFRPILLTAATTIAGMIPLYFGGGPMWEPMAVAIAFGLFFATALTLGVAPVLFALFFGIRFDGLTYEQLTREENHA